MWRIQGGGRQGKILPNNKLAHSLREILDPLLASKENLLSSAVKGNVSVDRYAIPSVTIPSLDFVMIY